MNTKLKEQLEKLIPENDGFNTCGQTWRAGNAYGYNQGRREIIDLLCEKLTVEVDEGKLNNWVENNLSDDPRRWKKDIKNITNSKAFRIGVKG